MKEVTYFLNSTLNYTEDLIRFIAKQIALVETSDKQKIFQILKHVNIVKRNIYSGSLFYLIDKNDIITVSTRTILTEQKRVLETERTFMKYTKKAPWKIYIGDIARGYRSKQLIIPVGMGITNSEGNYLGTIAVGIYIKSLEEQFKRHLESVYYRFIVLKDNSQLVTQSPENKNPTKKEIKLITEKLSNLKNEENFTGALDKNLNIAGVEYLLYSKTPDYPFTVLFGIDRKKTYHRNILENQILELYNQKKYTKMFLISLLYIFESKMVNPFADKEKQSDFKIPPVFSEKINKLFFELDRIADYEHLKDEEKVNKILTLQKQELAKNKEDFLNSVIKEIQSPLSIIKSFIQLIKSSNGISENGSIPVLNNDSLIKLKLSDKLLITKDELDAIENSADKIQNLTEEALILAKLKSDNFEVRTSFFNLENTIDSVIKLNLFSLRKSNLSIKKEIQINKEKDKGYKYRCYQIINNKVFFYGDEALINKILNHLVSNALRFTLTGSIVVRVKIKEQKNNKYFIIEVSDTGLGMGKQELSNVLNFKRRLNAENSYNDLGLHLSIIKDFIALYQGTIEIDSELHKGTTISLKFNLSLKQK